MLGSNVLRINGNKEATSNKSHNENAQRIFRVANKEIEFSKVPNDLHTENYSAILTGSNFFSFDKVEKTMNFMFSINE